MKLHQVIAICPVSWPLLATLALSGAVLAQDAPWPNRELEKNGMSREQIGAIYRADIAECSADARERVARAFGPPILCNYDAPTDEFNQCQDAREQRAVQQKALFFDSAIGCMARRGWQPPSRR